MTDNPSITSYLSVVYTTVSSREQAEKLAHEAVSLRYAACVNVIPGAFSVYEWEGKINTSEEVLLLFKTSPAQKDTLLAWLQEQHPYALPALLQGEIQSSEAFKEYVVHQTLEKKKIP